jgi:hypothetical protein
MIGFKGFAFCLRKIWLRSDAPSIISGRPGLRALCAGIWALACVGVRLGGDPVGRGDGSCRQGVGDGEVTGLRQTRESVGL